MTPAPNHSILFITAFRLTLALLLLYVDTFATEPASEKVIFANSIMSRSYYYSVANYTGASWIENIKGKLPVETKSFTPGNSLRLRYTNSDSGIWNARIIYHRIRGIDKFRTATHLVFRLYVDTETASENLPMLGVANRDEEPAEFVRLSDHIDDFESGRWLKVAIPLGEIAGSAEVSELNQVVLKSEGGSGEHTIYVDQIEFENADATGDVRQIPRAVSATGFEKHVDIVWENVGDSAVKYIKIYRSRDNKTFYPVGIQIPQLSRYADYHDSIGTRFNYRITFLNHDYKETTPSNIVSAATRHMTDDELLDMVQEAHLRYYWEGAEPHSGLALENIPGRRDMVASGASGFGIMALIVGVERKFISRADAAERFLKIVSFLEKSDKFHGAFSHFINGPSGKVEPFFGERDNGGDLVETSFLFQGLLTARQYFNGDSDSEKKIRSSIQKLWEGVEWKWYRRTKDNPFLLWHWSPDKEWIINHKLIGWNETMITYFLAIAGPKHGVPASMYYSGWASQDKEAQQYRTSWGKTEDGSQYANGKSYYGIKLPVGVSNGGPLFFVHYSYLGLDPRRMKDAYTDYFTNNSAIAKINYRYCVENPKEHEGYGEACWGLTASDGPLGYSANEPVPGMDEGKMTPTGGLASFPYTPEESMAALKNYYRNFGSFLWGEYGFRDAFNLTEDWCSEIFMGLNQAPIVVMIENHRSGLLWKLFMANADIQKALQKIEAEKVRQK